MKTPSKDHLTAQPQSPDPGESGSNPIMKDGFRRGSFLNGLGARTQNRTVNTKHLGTYLNDHLAGSRAALELFKQLKSANAGTPRGQVFADLLQEIEQDQTALRELLKELDFRESPIRQAVAWLAEKFVLKLLAGNPRDKLVRFEQLEILALGIEGKRALWLGLNAVAAQTPLFEPVDLMRLVQRAKKQRECVETIRLDAARDAFL
jgi:hypothetical protein